MENTYRGKLKYWALMDQRNFISHWYFQLFWSEKQTAVEFLWKFRPELRSLKQPATPIHIFFSFFQDAEIEPLNSKDPSELV